jgi:8-oxo-dGTP pyrophosphatase MutT (NUDIX family)
MRYILSSEAIMTTLADEIKEISASSPAVPAVRKSFLEGLKMKGLTRDENPAFHYCVYFLPYNSATKQVFITHHKKSGLWLAPGGHIDQGENLFQALKREIMEELGFEYLAHPAPFLLTVTPIPERQKLTCKIHYDVWYGIPTDGSEFNINPEEFHETRWVTISEARGLMIDLANLEALSKIETLFARAHAI